MALDRLEQLRGQNQVTGIDFIYVFPDQVRLDVFFLRDPLTLAAPLDTAPHALTADQVIIQSTSGGALPVVPVAGVAWQVSDGRNVLRVTTTEPGDFTRYRLRIDDPQARIDPYFNDVAFSFKANCESELDCEAAPHECPPEPLVDVPIDYTARDFWSFRQALLDFAAVRYPDWKDRLEADVGIMLAELMSATGDEMAYAQDRIAREAYLETAVERRSLRRHARLVDYELDDGLGAATWIDVSVDAAAPGGPVFDIPAGTPVSDQDAQMTFELGRGLYDQDPNLHLGLTASGTLFTVRATRNELTPHVWDEDDTCLPVGSTRLHVAGHQAANLPFDDPPDDPTGKWVLLKTASTNPAIPVRAWMVRVVSVVDMDDPVFAQPITELTWTSAQATPFELDLETLRVRGNLLPATAGRTQRLAFRIGDGQVDDPADAVERIGPNAVARFQVASGRIHYPDTAVAYLASLADTETQGLVWARVPGELTRPEVRLFEASPLGTQLANSDEWRWRRSLLGVNSSQQNDRHFTLDDGTWRRTERFRRAGDDLEHRDYAGGAGSTIRFGDGEFGKRPVPSTLFQAVYRVGNGRRGNLAADTLRVFDHAALPFVEAVTNPVPAVDGRDPEPPEQVRRNAPDAFRTITFRAVREEDYAEAAERLDWVERAGAAFRWTGSWLTAFVTPDPRGATRMTAGERIELTAQLDRFRQAGREAHTLDPQYADLDLEITICVEPPAHPGEVKARVLEALFGRGGLRPHPGFFAPDHFTFGTPLLRATLEAAIQAVPGVRALDGIQIRRRGWFAMRPFVELRYQPAANEVVRVENDLLLPERGAVRLTMRGGA